METQEIVNGRSGGRPEPVGGGYAKVIVGRIVAVDYTKETAKIEKLWIGGTEEFKIRDYKDGRDYGVILEAMKKMSNTIVVIDQEGYLSVIETKLY